MAVEKVQGISRLEQLCEEFSEEERVRELKQEKKRQKRKNRRKNKCVCEIPTPLQAAEEKEINQAKVNTDSCSFLLVLNNRSLSWCFIHRLTFLFCNSGEVFRNFGFGKQLLMAAGIYLRLAQSFCEAVTLGLRFCFNFKTGRSAYDGVFFQPLFLKVITSNKRFQMLLADNCH